MQELNRVKRGGSLIMTSVLALCLSACGMNSQDEVPEAWKHLVKTEGQAYPVPESWLSTPEGKIAHNLVLPASVPQPVPFDFEKAKGPWYWPASDKKIALAYFDHLCKTEAGEWILNKAENVDGLYFARPENQPTDDFLGDVYGPEAPWVERHFQLMGESARDRGQQFVEPPFRNFLFVEEPRREVKWQKAIQEPYIRLFGYTQGYFVKPGQVVNAMNELTPMQVVGLPEPTARYGYTWRGITRPQDRDYHLAGGELIIYDRQTKAVLAVSRSFQITRNNPRKPGSATWMVSPTCREGIDGSKPLPLSAFAGRVLLANNPLNSGKE